MYRYMTIAVICLMSLQVTAEKRPSVAKLTDKFQETQDKLRSFIIKEIVTLDADNSVKRGHGKNTKSYEFRSDGSRHSSRCTMWGEGVGIGFTPKDNPRYRSFLFDGESHIRYTKSGKYPLGRAMINKINFDAKKEKVYSGSRTGTSMMGYFFGDKKRIDSILRHPDTISSVRNELEQVGGSLCYVIDAAALSGKYTLWIDPHHGYNLAKAKVLRKKGDMFADNPLKGGRIISSMNNVRFEKIDGIWVPMEADANYDRIFSRGTFSKASRHRKRTKVIINPDHDALESFVPSDILDGARVTVVGIRDITYTWQDGKWIPDKGNVTTDTIDQ